MAKVKRVSPKYSEAAKARMAKVPKEVLSKRMSTLGKARWDGVPKEKRTRYARKIRKLRKV